jgi:hypothetical protein
MSTATAAAFSLPENGTYEEQRRAVLNAIGKGVLPTDRGLALLDQLDARFKPASTPKEDGPVLKIGQSGAISLYGVQKMPVTLYAEQWAAILSHAGKIVGFIEEHKDKPWTGHVKDEDKQTVFVTRSMGVKDKGLLAKKLEACKAALIGYAEKLVG